MIYENRDEVINRFYTELDSAQLAFMKRLKVYLRGGITDIELARLLVELDFYNELGESGYFKALNNYIGKQEQAIAEIIRLGKERGVNIGALNLAMLDEIIQIDAKVIMRSGAMYSEQIKSALVKNIVGGIPRKQLVDELLPEIQETIPFRSNWLETAIDQSFTSLGNTALKETFSDEPNTRFKLVHIQDARTRRLCNHAINEMKKYPKGLTVKEIESGKLTKDFIKITPSENDKYTFTNVGGFKCRGWWEIEN